MLERSAKGIKGKKSTHNQESKRPAGIIYFPHPPKTRKGFPFLGLFGIVSDPGSLTPEAVSSEVRYRMRASPRQEPIAWLVQGSTTHCQSWSGRQGVSRS